MTAAVDRLGSLRPEDVAALDAAAVAAGVGVLQLMEIAGWQVARCALAILGRKGRHVAVVAGRGNNGGDGLVAARHLCSWGLEVRAVVVAAPGAELRPLLQQQLSAARGAGVEVQFGAGAVVTTATAGTDLAIDGVLGTGLRDAPRDLDAVAIEALAGAAVLAIDVPSGLDAGSGEAYTPCVTAQVTCTLTAMKAGLWTPSGRARAGLILVADIGMPRTAWVACGLAPPSAIRGGELVRAP